MAVNKTKLTSGGEIGEVSKKRNKLTPLLERFKKLSTFRQIVVLFALGMGALLVITAVSLIYGLIAGNTGDSGLSSQVKAEQVCNNELINRASSNLTSDKMSTLQPIVEEIKKQSNYNNDPNCLIPIFVYAINTNNVSEATSLYGQIRSFSVDSYQINALYGAVGIISIRDLDLRLEGLQKRQEEFKQNTRYF